MRSWPPRTVCRQGARPFVNFLAPGSGSELSGIKYTYKIQKEVLLKNNFPLWPPPKEKLASEDSVETWKHALWSIFLLLDQDPNCRVLSTRTISKKRNAVLQVLKIIVLSGPLPRRSWPPRTAWRQEARACCTPTSATSATAASRNPAILPAT
jgi:hypothetical protein